MKLYCSCYIFRRLYKLFLSIYIIRTSAVTEIEYFEQQRETLNKEQAKRSDVSLKYMFAAMRRSAIAEYENCVLITYIITKRIKIV